MLGKLSMSLNTAYLSAASVSDTELKLYTSDRLWLDEGGATELDR